MTPKIDAASVEAALAFVASREQGATCREVAEAVFGDGSYRSSARVLMGQILRVCAALGHVRPEHDCDGVLVYHRTRVHTRIPWYVALHGKTPPERAQ